MPEKVFELGPKSENLSLLFDRAISSGTFEKNPFCDNGRYKKFYEKKIELRSYLKNFRLIIL